MATEDRFSPLDAAMLRVGVAVALVGILLQALDFVLLWPSLELNMALCLAGVSLITVGAIGCHRGRREETSLPVPLTQDKAS